MEVTPTLKQELLSYLDEIRKEYATREAALDEKPPSALRHVIIGPITSIYAMALQATKKPQYMETAYQQLQSVTPLLRNNWDKMPKELKDKLNINEIEDQISRLEQLQTYYEYPNKLAWALDVIEATDRITTVMDRGLENFDIETLDNN